MQAIVVNDDKSASVADAPVPKLRDDHVLVKVKAVALNPTDWKHATYGISDAGSKLGCDYAGIVEEVGASVTKFKKGDRIAGVVHGGYVLTFYMHSLTRSDRTDHENGAFGEYLIAIAVLQLPIPEHWKFEQAATLGVSVVTVGQGLYKTLQLPQPSPSPKTSDLTLLIYGGSTATGLYGIQYAKASGVRVVATASPRNFDYLKSLGVEAAFDYNSPTCGADIRAYTDDKLVLAWDCTGKGAEVIGAALSSTEKSAYSTIIPVKPEDVQKVNPNVSDPVATLGYDCLGHPFWWGGGMRVPDPTENTFALGFINLTAGLLDKGVIKPINLEVNRTGSGLQGALKGMEELKDGKVSATKLVYTLD